MEALSAAEGRGLPAARSRFSLQNPKTRDTLAFLIFVLPALAWFLAWMLWPFANMFYISTLKWDGLVRQSEYIGLGNYARLLTDPHFAHAVRNSAIHIFVALPATMVPAFILGFFLSLRRPGYRLLRLIFFSPAMLSVAALAMMFSGVFMPEGIINSLLTAAGLDSLTRNWLANPSTVLGAIISLDLWGGIGFYSVLFFAVLSTISPELYEAARLDGASLWTMLWSISFPLSRQFFGVATMLHFLWLLTGSAQNVLILTHGGPGDYSLTLGYYLFEQAFSTQRLGYSQALGVVLFVVGLLGLGLIRAVFRPADE
jgi:multiple sugar transport system permease protein